MVVVECFKNQFHRNPNTHHWQYQYRISLRI